MVRRSGMHAGLAAAIEALTGTVAVLADVRATEAAAWRAASAPLAEARTELAGWCTDPGTATLLRRLAGTSDAAARLATELVAVLDALPVAGEPLARLAARTTDDAHALDPDRPLATLVRSAIRATWWDCEPLPESAAMQRRMLWYAVGVTVDELSSTVLAVNLPTQPGCRLHILAGPAAALGEPVVLTLRQLTRDEPAFTADEVYARENPTVLASAADRQPAARPAALATVALPGRGLPRRTRGSRLRPAAAGRPSGGGVGS